MVLDLSTIRTPPERYERSYGAEAFGVDDAFRVVGPVMLAFDIFKETDQFRLNGRVTAALELSCCRCLDPFACPVDTPFELCYQPQPEVGDDDAEREREIAEKDLTTAYYTDDEIDLGQLMKEQFVLSLPMKPLCRDECRGLCPHCGTNLNAGACACKSEREDPRLATLRTLTVKSGS
jgi:uncharacterized protein